MADGDLMVSVRIRKLRDFLVPLRCGARTCIARLEDEAPFHFWRTLAGADCEMSIEVRVTSKGERRYDVRLRDPAGKTYTARTFHLRERTPSDSSQRSGPTKRAGRGSILAVATSS